MIIDIKKFSVQEKPFWDELDHLLFTHTGKPKQLTLPQIWPEALSTKEQTWHLE